MAKSLFFLFIAIAFLSNDLTAQTLSGKEIKWLTKKAVSLETPFKPGEVNWNALDKYFNGKQIVMLGEFTHGSREINEAHNSMIRYLHKVHGFNTVLFESGIGELAAVEFYKAGFTGKEMAGGLIGPWWKQSFFDLMTYIKAEDIAVSGFDVQRSGWHFSKLIREVAEQHHIDTSLYKDLEQRFGKAQRVLRNRKTEYDSVKLSANNLIEDYRKLHQTISETTAGRTASQKDLLVIRTIENRIGFLDYFLTFVKNKDWRARWTARDSIMAENVCWLKKHIFPGEKMIILAHNFHIAKHNEKEEVMGEFLAKKLGDDLFAVGFFAGQGSYTDNSGKEKPMAAPDPDRLDIKHVIEALPGSFNFLGIPAKEKKCYPWLFSPIVVNDSFIDLNGSDLLTLSRQFNAIVSIKKISAPENK